MYAVLTKWDGLVIWCAHCVNITISNVEWECECGLEKLHSEIKIKSSLKIKLLPKLFIGRNTVSFFFLRLFYLFIYQMLPPPCPHSQSSTSIPSFLHLWEGAPTWGTPQPWAITSSHYYSHPLTRMPDKAALYYVYAWCLEPAHVCSPGVQVSWYCWSSYGVTITFSSFNPPTSSLGDPNLSPMFSFKCLPLSQSAAGRLSHRTAMLASCLQAKHSITNSVRDWCLHMVRTQSWASHLWAIRSVSALFFVSVLFFRQEQFWVKSCVGGLMCPPLYWGPVLALEVVSSVSVVPLLGILAKVTHIESWEPSLSALSGTFCKSLPTALHASCIFPLIPLALWAAFLSASTPDPVPFFPFTLPSPTHIAPSFSLPRLFGSPSK